MELNSVIILSFLCVKLLKETHMLRYININMFLFYLHTK